MNTFMWNRAPGETTIKKMLPIAEPQEILTFIMIVIFKIVIE